LSFFGLTQSNAAEIRKILFSNIHEIVYHGNGGYSWETIYNMPIWLRKFTYHLIKEFIESQNPNKSAEDSWVQGKPVQKINTIDPKKYSGFNYNAVSAKK